jgi:hypothetical protein
MHQPVMPIEILLQCTQSSPDQKVRLWMECINLISTTMLVHSRRMAKESEMNTNRTVYYLWLLVAFLCMQISFLSNDCCVLSQL